MNGKPKIKERFREHIYKIKNGGRYNSFIYRHFKLDGLGLDNLAVQIVECLSFDRNTSSNFNSLEVINAIKSKRYTVSEINTFDFSTLYTSLPLYLVKTKLIGLVEKTFAREKTSFVVVNKNKAFFSDNKYVTRRVTFGPNAQMTSFSKMTSK